MLVAVGQRRSLSPPSKLVHQYVHLPKTRADLRFPDTGVDLPLLHVLYLPEPARRVHREDDRQDLQQLVERLQWIS